MRIDIVSLFPEGLQPYLQASVIGKAQQAGLVEIRLHNLRDYASDRHRTTDSEPYGGGGGMVLRPEPLFAAIEALDGAGARVILLTPQGRRFDHAVASELTQAERLILIAGRYEGVDERVREHLVDDEISLGDFVLTGGEIPALAVTDAVVRLLPGVLGSELASSQDSFSTGLLEGPHYTRPEQFRGWRVPEVLLSGDHGRIAAWRRKQALKRTLERRPDLLQQQQLSADDLDLLDRLRSEQQ